MQEKGARVDAIARAYADQPHGTVIVSPDNACRRAINQAVKEELEGRGMLEPDSGLAHADPKE